MDISLKFKTIADVFKEGVGHTEKFKSCIHSGNAGDIIYSLPTVKKLGAGHFIMNASNAPGFGARFLDEKTAFSLIPLLLDQPYIKRVSIVFMNNPFPSNFKTGNGILTVMPYPLEYMEEYLTGADYILDKFRLADTNNNHLILCHSQPFGVEINPSEKWLFLEGEDNKKNADGKISNPSNHKYRIVLALTPRYRSKSKEFWADTLKDFKDDILAIGVPNDFADISGITDKFITCRDFLELARIINGADLFIGNPGMSYAVAEGLKIPRIVELPGFPKNAYPLGENGHIAPESVEETKKAINDILNKNRDTDDVKAFLPNNDTYSSANINIKISVCIPVFNHKKYIAQCIESVLLQDYKNIEIIISDNCSTDGTIDVIKGYLWDERIRFYQNESNIGMVRNAEKVLYYAKGDFMVFLSSDDYWSDPTFLSQVADRIHADNDLIMVCGGKKYFKEEGNVTRIDDFSDNTDCICDGRQIILGGEPAWKPFELGAILIKADSAKKIFDFRYTLPGNDVLYFWKLCLQGKVYILRKPFLMFRVHGNNAGRGDSIDYFIKNLIGNSLVPIIFYNDIKNTDYFLKIIINKWLVKNIVLLMIGPWGWDNFSVLKNAYESELANRGFSISEFGIESLLGRLRKIKNFEEKIYYSPDNITEDYLGDPDGGLMSVINNHILAHYQVKNTDYKNILKSDNILKQKIADYLKKDLEAIGGINYDGRIKKIFLESGITEDKIGDFFDVFIYSKIYQYLPAKIKYLNFTQNVRGSLDRINGADGPEFNIPDSITDIHGNGWVMNDTDKTAPDAVYLGFSQDGQIKYFLETKLHKRPDIVNKLGLNPAGSYGYHFSIPSAAFNPGRYDIVSLFVTKENIIIFNNGKKINIIQ